MEFPRDFGPYRLLKQIAMGGMAEIVLAKTIGFGGFEKLLALKMIHPKFSTDDHFINMLIEEAKICVELEHVNIGQVFDLGRLGNTYYISMEFVEGADIFGIMRRGTDVGYEVPIENCAHIAGEICSGLDYAHRKRDSEGRPLGIIHRDISPQNVLISYAGEVKIVDFGIAKAGLRAQQTEVGVIKGKYYYMSPEQAWGDPVDHRTDIFSAGIIIYEMLTGQMLYLEENIDVLLDRVRKADIPPPRTLRPDVPPELEEIVMRALSKQPERRYETAHDMGQALRAFLYSSCPDFTSARVASMMAWLFEKEKHEPAESVPATPSKKADDGSLLLTRDDFTAQPRKAAGSLLMDLLDLDEIGAALIGTDEYSETDPTSQVQLPDLLPEFAAGLELGDSTDRTAPVDVPRDLQQFPSAPPADEDWDDGDDATFVETAENLKRRMDAAHGKPGPPGGEKPRGADDVTQQLDASHLGAVGPGRSQSGSPSYVPPSPGSDGSPGPASGYVPPTPPTGASSSPHPRAAQSRAPQGKAISTPPSNPPPPPPGSAKSSRPPSIPRPSSPPIGPPPPKPPPSRTPPPVSSAGDDREPTGQTALVPQALQLDPRSLDKDTGPTAVVSRDALRPAPSTRELPGGPAAFEETNPTVVLPKHELDDDPTGPTQPQPGEPPRPKPQSQDPPPAPSSEPPPWLLGGDESGASPLSDPDMLDDDLLAGPPNAEDVRALRQTDFFKHLWKVLLVTAGVAVLAVAIFLLWPRPDPVSRLDIRSHPPGAQVFLDGRSISGRTPLKLDGLKRGAVHSVELRLDGHANWTQPVQLNAEEVRQIAVLNPIRGRLRVTSEPIGASVLIDGVYQGATPHHAEGLDVNRPIEIQVRSEDQTQTKTLNWQGRTEATEHFRFEPSRGRRR